MTDLALSGSQQATKWVLIAIGILFVVAIVLLRVRGTTKRASSWWRGRELSKRIRSNNVYDLEVKAWRSVLRLGQRIDVSEIEADSNDAHWAKALDCYSLARRAEERNRDAADQLGAVVLASMGQRHLDAAVYGEKYDERPRCYFDPRHGPSGGPVPGPGGFGPRVPGCPYCAKAAPGSRDTFTVKGVPYYKASLEPWSSSGFGALEDLVAAAEGHDW